MTKLRNKIVLVLLALCLAVCAGVFAACGDDKPKDNAVTYTVTVTAGGAAAEGVQVTVKKGSTTLGKPATTNSSGTATFKLAEDAGYTVTLTDLPRGYKVAEGAELKFDSDRKLDVVLEEKPVSYTIKLVNPDNTAYSAAGVLVGICTVEGNNCLELVQPDANGTVKIYDAAKTDYHIQVKGLPEGYAFESDGTYALKQNEGGTYVDAQLNKEYVSLSDTVVEQTIKIYPVNVIKLTDDAKLSDDELANNYSYVDGMAAYKMNIAVAANTTAYYEYTADYSGEYNFYANNYELAYKLNGSFLLGDSYIGGSGMFNPTAKLDKGEKYYFNITNAGDESATVELIMSTPYATFTTVSGLGTTKAEVNKQGKNAAIELEPTAGSTYKLTVTGNGAIKQADSSYMVQYVEFDDTDYTNSKELTVKYTEDMQASLYFAVSVKADKYPASVDVKIEKIGTCPNQTVVVQPVNLTQTTDNDDFNKELAPVAMSATVVKGDDGKYHLGTATGPIVYVNLMGDIGAVRYKYNSYELVYMEYATEFRVSAYVFDVTTDDDKAAIDKGNTYKDYRTVLRGFADYLGSGSKPADEDLADDYYAKYVNSDGVYPLDDTLKDYLELAAPQLDTEWLFACYYYADYAEPDEIVGEYKTEDGQFILTVEKFGEYTIRDVDDSSMYYDLGTWTKSESGDYTFTCNYGELTYGADGNIVYEDFIGEMTFMPSSGEEEEDPEPDTELFSTEMSRADASINAARLWLYNDGTCILWQFNGRTYMYDKIATANWWASNDGTQATITNITVMEDYEFTITAEYNLDVEHMAGVITVTLTQGEGEDETSTPYTFNMPLQ